MASPRPETRFAKQLFLFGNGDGKPVRHVPTLSKLSGVHVNTLNSYLPEWEKEAEEILAGKSETGLAMRLGKKEIEDHNSDMIHLRDQISQIKFELNTLEILSEKMANWLDKFEGEDYPNALSIFDAWQRACGQKSSLRSQFLAMQRQWTSLSGIVDMKDIEVTRAKEITKGKARIELKKLENEKPAETARIAGGLFARRDRIEILEE